jgi:hypothetical protein
VAWNFSVGYPTYPPDDISLDGGTVSPSSAFNLIGTGGAGGLTNGTNGNQVGVTNPQLGPLASNGGPTQTIALLIGSPAIDKGSGTMTGVTVPTIDQRGALRGPAGLNAGTTVDVGAYEASSSYRVTTAADSTDMGTLRAAVGWANVSSNVNPGNSPTAPNTIVFDTGGLFATPQTITLSALLGTLNLTNTSTVEAINGPGANLVTISGNNAVRVFGVASGVVANLAGLTISDGKGYNGGGIDNSGTLTVSDSTLANNSATYGGGIENDGRLTVSSSTVANNSADNFGGGISSGGTLTVSNSTLTQNSAAYGGGGINCGGTVTVSSSTLANNSASIGGGIYHFFGTLMAVNDTIAYNTVANSGSGGGLVAIDGTATLDNTVVALNTRGTDSAAPHDDISILFSGKVSPSSASNLIGTGGAGGLTNGTNGNQVGVTNPLLGPLAPNGGPTQTIALLSGSPAIDSGSNDLAVDPTSSQPLSTDQRGTGFPRISHNTVDIGAYELQAVTQLVVMAQPPSVVTAGASFGLTVAAEDSSGNVVPSFNDVLTVALANNSGAGILGGTLTVTAVNGVATFAGLKLDKAASAYTLQVSSPSATATTITASFDVAAAAATQLVITTPPPVQIGAGGRFGLIVTAEDPFGNVDPSFTRPVRLTLASNPGGATLGGIATVAAVNGRATFAGLSLNRAGNGYSLSTVSSGLSPAKTSAFNVMPAPTIVRELVLTAGNGKQKHVVGFQFIFSAALDPTRAQNAANYTITQSVIQLVKRRPTTVAQPVAFRVVYNASLHAVSLMVAGKPQFAKGGRIVVKASPPKGLTGTSGAYVDGNGHGVPGGDGVFKILPKGGGVVH